MGDPVSTMIIVDVALAAASMAMTASQKFSGPRLSELNVTLSEYGTPLPRFWGIRRFECPIIWAEKLREKKKKSKTKGGKYTDYKYFGSWAVAVADNEIDSVSRIWFDRHLTFDTTGVGPISLAALLGQDDSTVKLVNGQNMRTYLGTEDQEPDPRITTWCEDRYGANTAPAYKGVAYIVFQDIPLEKFGNRIPQISVEAIHTKANTYPIEAVTSGGGLDNVAISADYQRLALDSSSSVLVYDVPTRTLTTTTDTGFSFGNPIGIAPSSLYALDNGDLYQGSLDGTGWTFLANVGVVAGYSGVQCFGDTGIYLTSTAGAQPCAYTGAGFAFSGSTGLGNVTYWEDLDANIWSAGSHLGNTVIYCMSGGRVGESYTITGMDVPYFVTNPNGDFMTADGSGAYLFANADFTLIDTNATAGFWVRRSEMISASPGATSVWFSTIEVSTTTLEVLRIVSMTDFLPGSTIENTKIYDPISNALIVHPTAGPYAGQWVWCYLDRVGSNGVTLQTVVDDVAEWCGLTGQDTAALTQTVQGYSVTQGSGKDMIAPLLDIHDVDPRPHDFAIQFVNRGSSALGTISTSEIARDGDENRYVAAIAQDTDLPRKITFNFADKDHDQQANNVIAQRPLDAVDATREQTIDLGTYVSTPTEAQKFSDRYLRRKWIGRDTFTLSLTAQRLALEPADVYNLELDGITTTARLSKLTVSGGKLNTEWERDYPSITTLGTGTGADMEGRDPEVIYIPGPTKGFIRDIPLLSDADSNSNPILYYGAGPYSTTQNWPGAYFMQSDLDAIDYDIQWNALDSSQGSEWGYATDALGNTNPNVWDRGSSVNVKGNLSLTSCTEAQIDADPTLNLALLGDELINFTTATLEGDGSYTLSGFKRGRRGTEWATSTHAMGDEFVMVSDMLNEGEGLSDVGTTLHFKAQTLGRPIDTAPAIDIDFTGASLKPYAAARLKAYYDGTDLQCTIFRRTRVGGAWTGGSTIPLSENSESYEIDVYNGATLKRTITATTTTFTYTAAMAAADGITLPTPPTFNVYQMSDAVGRGFALAA